MCGMEWLVVYNVDVCTHRSLPLTHALSLSHTLYLLFSLSLFKVFLAKERLNNQGFCCYTVEGIHTSSKCAKLKSTAII